MSCNYADALSPYENKGKCGLPEIFDNAEQLEAKVRQLSDLIVQSKKIVFHTGAGISTAAGIPDFRGPKGVWTLEKRGERPTMSIPFDSALPTKTHMAIISLAHAGLNGSKLPEVYVVSQNVDGLHMRSGLPRTQISELHGNMFLEQCNKCQRQYIRGSNVPTLGQKSLDKQCPHTKKAGRACRGTLYDNILDWEAQLPENDLFLAEKHIEESDLNICLGTTLQINPAGALPLNKKNSKNKIVVCNLQPTKLDNRAYLRINSYVDDIMLRLLKVLGVPLMAYDPIRDLVLLAKKQESAEGQSTVEWTIVKSSLDAFDSVRERKRARSKLKSKTKADEQDEGFVDKKPKLESESDSVIVLDG